MRMCTHLHKCSKMLWVKAPCIVVHFAYVPPIRVMTHDTHPGSQSPPRTGIHGGGLNLDPPLGSMTLEVLGVRDLDPKVLMVLGPPGWRPIFDPFGGRNWGW